MKKIILGILLSLLIISCDVPDNTSDFRSYKEKGGYGMTMFGQGEFEGIDNSWDIDILDDPIGTITEFSVNDSLAMVIGDAILREAFGENILSGTELVGCEVAKGNFYIISRIPDDDCLGGDYSVAINMEDGKIFRIWMGE